MTVNVAGRLATCTRLRLSSAAVMRCQDYPIAGIIYGWRGTAVVCHLMAVHTGLAEIPVGLPRIDCRLDVNKHAHSIPAADGTRTFTRGTADDALASFRGNTRH